MKEQKLLFLVEFFLRYIGGGQIFEKTRHGKLLFSNEAWLYVLGTREEDFKAVIKNLKKLQEQGVSWERKWIVVEAKNIDECLDILLSHVRCGYNYRKKYCHFDYYTFVDKSLNGLTAVPNADKINFDNWPIRIEKITTYPYCDYINKKWKEKGFVICCEPLIPNCLSESDMCPISCRKSALDDGDCLISAHIYSQRTSTQKEINIHNQKFILEEVS